MSQDNVKCKKIYIKTSDINDSHEWQKRRYINKAQD